MDFLRDSCSSSGYIPLTGMQMTLSPDLTVFDIIGERKLINDGDETSSPTSRRMWLPRLRPPPRMVSRLLIPVEECDAVFLMTGYECPLLACEESNGLSIRNPPSSVNMCSLLPIFVPRNL